MEALIVNRRKFLVGSAALVVVTPLCLTTTGCNIDWIATAEKDIPVIVNIVDSLASVALQASGNGLITPVVLLAIKTAAAAAQTGLQTLSQIIADEKAQPSASTVQKIETAISDIGNSLSSILGNLNITNSGLLQTITAGIALAISTLSSISLLIPVQVVTPGPAATKKASMQKQLMVPIKMIDASTLASMYNTVAVANGYASHQVTLSKK